MCFSRRLSPNGLSELHAMANDDSGNWWKDLLTLWRPGGAPTGTYGLRLAIRNGYMNFYFRGQSIAKVCFGRGGTPRIETHVKYVADGQTDQKYAQLNGSSISLPGGGTSQYEGLKTLHRWIDRAAQYKTNEKPFVDDLVGANGSVIDLEMGLPAWGERTFALRLDLVALNKAADGVHLCFWEAKLISDSRLRSHNEPKVLKQIADYEAFLDYDGHEECVRAAYHETCKLLIEFKGMAEKCGHPGVALHEAITEAATEKSRIIINRPLRLVIFEDKVSGGGGNWKMHARKLKEGEVSFIVLDGSNPKDRSLPGVGA